MSSVLRRGLNVTGAANALVAVMAIAGGAPALADPVAAPGVGEVFFDFDRADIRPDAEVVLEDAARALKADESRPVRVIGHTDAPGSSSYNLALGERRAKAAAARLIDAGVAPERIKVETRGEADPLVPTPGRAEANRRVSIVPAACTSWRDVALSAEDEAASPEALQTMAEEAAALRAELSETGTLVGAYMLSGAAVSSCGIAAGYETGEPRRMEYARKCLCDSDRMRMAAYE